MNRGVVGDNPLYPSRQLLICKESFGYDQKRDTVVSSRLFQLIKSVTFFFTLLLSDYKTHFSLPFLRARNNHSFTEDRQSEKHNNIPTLHNYPEPYNFNSQHTLNNYPRPYEA